MEECIKALRHELAQEKIVSFFQTPDRLTNLVSTAVIYWEKSPIPLRLETLLSLTNKTI